MMKKRMMKKNRKDTWELCDAEDEIKIMAVSELSRTRTNYAFLGAFITILSLGFVLFLSGIEYIKFYVGFLAVCFYFGMVFTNDK